MDQPYTIPIVLHDLPPAEALHQVFDNLKNLDITISDAFTRIAGRIKTEREKVAKVVTRVEAAAVKVKQIGENQSKVTTIYSTAKYPAPKILPDAARIVPPDSPSIPSLDKTAYILTKKQAVANPASVDTSHLFHVLTKNRAARADTDNPLDEMSREGLGRLPAYFPSISSILLFNSDENPYKDYVSINNLEGVGGKDREEGVEGLPEAPTSLITGAYLPVFSGLGYEYKPDLGDVPLFNLPQNLPLGKIADIQFGMPSDKVERIAPSVASLPSFAFPTFQALPAPSATKRSQPPPAAPAAPVSSSHTSSIPAAPSAPPPAPSMHHSGPPPAFASDIPAPPPVDDGAPAPPPMLDDAPAAPPLDDEVKSGGGAEPKSPPAGGGGGREDLLEAIRNAGKKRPLRKVADSSATEEKKQPKKPAAEPMDMMSALRARLAMRHQAITGKYTVEKKEESGGSIPKLNDDGEEGAPRPAPGSRLKISDVAGAFIAEKRANEETEDWEDNN